ncbi:unnamed protein product [Eruca vesicaria subsp. sativa]|uniref:Vesicle-fusing ATPase n=1 Tax=Eruca vesicaria subsp. sativa TaxID=29727 RepID=A0ABC8JRG0_ERUVS|nr:unnamed protein product [Eruca vesicaria subsp. sativa]
MDDSSYDMVLTVGQKATFEYHGTNYILTVNRADVEGQNQTNGIERGMLCQDTYIVFEASNASGIKIVNQREAASSNIFKHKEFNLESLSIGGLAIWVRNLLIYLEELLLLGYFLLMSQADWV